MPYVKSTNYRDIPFSSETPKDEFYTYRSITDLVKKIEASKERLINCITIGILQSKEGRFLLSDVENPSNEVTIRVSVVYLADPPQTTVVPYPVQIFGTLQWRNRPVVFARGLQVLTISSAIRLQKAMSAITAQHLAKEIDKDDDIIDLT